MYSNLVLNFDLATSQIKAIEIAVIFRATEIQKQRLIQSLPFLSLHLLYCILLCFSGRSDLIIICY